MEKFRLNSIWKKVISALLREADGRVRPVRPWHEAEAPGGEGPEEMEAREEHRGELFTEIPLPPGADEPEPGDEGEPVPAAEGKPGEEPVVEGPDVQVSESTHGAVPAGNVWDSVGKKWVAPSDPDYVFHKMEEMRRAETGRPLQESMLLDPSEKERALEEFKRWDPKFLHEKFEPQDMPSPSRRVHEQPSTKIQRDELKKGLDDAVSARAEEKGKALPSKVKMQKLQAAVEDAQKRLDSFDKKYGEEAQKRLEEREQRDIRKEYKYDKLDEMAARYRSEADPEKRKAIEGEMAAELERLEKLEGPELKDAPEVSEEESAQSEALKEYEERMESIRGLAGELLAKPDKSLNKPERERLKAVLNDIYALLSRRELRMGLDDERRTVYELQSVLRKLTDKFSGSAGVPAERERKTPLSRRMDEIIGGGESARQSVLMDWHANDPVKIAISSRLLVLAGGGTKQTLRDKLLGKTPVRTKGPSHVGYLPDLTTGISGFSPALAAEKLIAEGSARSIFLEAVDRAFKMEFGAIPGGPPDTEAIFSEAAELAWPILEADYSRLMAEPPSKAEAPVLGPPTEIEVAWSGHPQRQPGSMSPEDIKSSFVRDFVSTANSAYSLAARRAAESVSDDGGDVEVSESVHLSEEEKAAKSKDVLEARERAGAPLEVSILYYSDGMPKDIKVLYTELPEERHSELKGLLEQELKRLKMTDNPDVDVVGRLEDNHSQLEIMLSGREEVGERATRGSPDVVEASIDQVLEMIEIGKEEADAEEAIAKSISRHKRKEEKSWDLATRKSVRRNNKKLREEAVEKLRQSLGSMRPSSIDDRKKSDNLRNRLVDLYNKTDAIREDVFKREEETQQAYIAETDPGLKSELRQILESLSSQVTSYTLALGDMAAWMEEYTFGGKPRERVQLTKTKPGTGGEERGILPAGWRDIEQTEGVWEGVADRPVLPESRKSSAEYIANIVRSRLAR